MVSDQDESVMQLVENLTPEQRNAIRRHLNRIRWQEQFEAFSRHVDGSKADSNKLGVKFAAVLQILFDELESGVLDEKIISVAKDSWSSLVKVLVDAELPEEVRNEEQDLEFKLELIYQDLQSNLNSVRQAVAQAIATEKLLESQINKNRDQAQTWQNRSSMAEQQGNDDLVRQSQQHKKQYDNAADELLPHLHTQKEAVSSLRSVLAQLEGKVQTAYTKKQVLVVRQKAAEALISAHEIIASFDETDALRKFSDLEEEVLEKEKRAKEKPSITPASLEDLNQFSANAVECVDRLVEAMKKIEELIIEKENEARGD